VTEFLVDVRLRAIQTAKILSAVSSPAATALRREKNVSHAIKSATGRRKNDAFSKRVIRE
jgi:hypothetical protein